jgi:hypothetical protein
MTKLLDPAATKSVLRSVRIERKAQDRQWGVQDHDPITWIAILGEEFGEATRCALQLRFDNETGDEGPGDLIEELIQVAAVAVGAIESLERQLSYREDAIQ